MTSKCWYFFHGGILPDHDCIVRVTMSADEFLRGLAKHQVANLRPCLYGLKLLTNLSVPKLYASISRASAWDQQRTLMRAPGYGFDCCLMGGELVKRCIRSWLVCRPNHQLIVVSSRGKILVIEWPFQTTDLLLMTLNPRDVRVFAPQVTIQNRLILGARAEHVRVGPRERTDSTFVTFECPQKLLGFSIPKMYNSRVSSSSQVLATKPWPANWGYKIFILAVVMELGDPTSRCIPNVDTLRESDS